MKRYRLVILAFAVFVSATTRGQLFRPLGLGIEKCEQMWDHFRPQMHVEGNILYVCTNQGLYSKDLSAKDSAWQLVGFENIPLQDFVRREDCILALQYSIRNHYFLLSHDGGKTYQDATPRTFYMGEAESVMTLISLVPHPFDPNMLLVSSNAGIYQSPDFGQTWNPLTYLIIPRYIGYHPLNPEIIYASGESELLRLVLNISYDGGQTWQYNPPYYSDDNCVNRMAFHPTDSDRWIVGGSSAVYISNDNGHTWDTQDFSGNGLSDGFWAFTAYDDENCDIIYMAGRTQDRIKVMCSTDGGETWSIPQTELMKKSSTEEVYDFEQYGGKLLFYTESDVYEISKAELLAQASSVRSITTTRADASSDIYDLQGRRLSAKPQKGLYIQNGKKKVVVKVTP